jgi:hypothetical protein
MEYWREANLLPGWHWPHQYGRFIFESEDYDVLLREYEAAAAVLPAFGGGG